MAATFVDNRIGGYRSIPGSRFAAHAVLGANGHSIDRGVFSVPVPWEHAFDAIEVHLAGLGRPVQALCGVDLRMPKTLPHGKFREFNDRYLAELDRRRLLHEGTSPFARTNVAPTVNELRGPVVAAFSYTMPTDASAAYFLLSGAAETPVGGGFPADIIRRGETSLDALHEKARAVTQIVDGHLRDLGVTWDGSATVHLYASHDLAYYVGREALREVGVVPSEGIVWHDAAPPTEEIELEIDVRRYRTEILIEEVPREERETTHGSCQGSAPPRDLDRGPTRAA